VEMMALLAVAVHFAGRFEIVVGLPSLLRSKKKNEIFNTLTKTKLFSDKIES